MTPSSPITVSPAGEVSLVSTWAPTPATEVRVLATRRGRRGDARVYLRADAQRATARPAGPISVEGSGAHIANNHNARLMRDVPLLVVSGLVETMTPQEGARIAEVTRARTDLNHREMRAREEVAFAAAVAELEAIDPDAAVVLAVWARWKLPVLIGALALKKAARRLRAGRSVPQLTNARYWLPTSDVVVDGQHVEGLRYWTGDVEVFGSAHDAVARDECRAAYATAGEFTQRCATIFDDPLTPCWIDLPARPAKKCDAGRPAMRVRVQTIAERHPRVMRQLRERSPLPRAA